MVSSNGWSRRGLLAGATILTAGGAAAAKDDRLVDGVVILIDSNEPYVMGHAVSYSANLAKHFADKGAKLLIEVVANGNDLPLLHSDVGLPPGRAGAVDDGPVGDDEVSAHDASDGAGSRPYRRA